MSADQAKGRILRGCFTLAVSDPWKDELRARREALLELLDRHGCDLGLVFGTLARAEHVRYLTMFSPSMGDAWLVVQGDGRVSGFLDFTRQIDDARRRSGLDGWHAEFTAAGIVADALAAERPRRLGVAGLDRIPGTAFDSIRARLSGIEIEDVGPELAALRRRKSRLELELLREAARRTDRALDAARREARPGITEEELAAHLGLELGPEWSFAPCVISGQDDPVPIREPGDRRLAEGDTVMLDLGAAYQGYQADASRTLVLGEPSRLQHDVWDAVRRGYEAALAAVRPGTPCAVVQEAAARVVEEAGFRLAHRIGHGIGLTTSFEWPSLDRDREPLEPGMTICIEPAVCLDGAGVMKLEDDLLVTDDGCEVLTAADSSLSVR
jgi:Xaa-Pro dipeptidase